MEGPHSAPLVHSHSQQHDLLAPGPVPRVAVTRLAASTAIPRMRQSSPGGISSLIQSTDRISPLASSPPPATKLRSSLAPEPARQELEEERSRWLHDALADSPHFLAMRERALSFAGGYSFANIAHTQRVSALACLNRHVILELVSQHLSAIGMYRTAEILAQESGHVFQLSVQPWDRTDLHLLCSLAVGHRDNAWDLPRDVDSQYAEEAFEEDFFASPYREDPSLICQELYDPDLNVIFDKSGPRNLAGIQACSLRRFVVYFATRETLDNEELAMFFLSLHSITSASHFLEHMVTLYDMEIDEERLCHATGKSESAELAFLCIARNIVNMIKQWKDYHMGRRTLKFVTQFLSRMQTEQRSEKVHPFVPGLLKAIAELSAGTKRDAEDTKDFKRPAISSPVLLFKPNLNLLDPDPLEVGRQITLMYHEKYASIHSLEFIIGITNRKTTIRTPTLADFFGFGDSLTLLFAEAFVNADDKQAAFHRMLEIARCLAPSPTTGPSGNSELHNLDALACILRFLRRPDVEQLGLATQDEIRELADFWVKSGEHTNHEASPFYDDFIQKQFNQWKVTIPNMHAELKSGPKAAGREPDFINGLINWGKLRPQAKRCVVLNRFQVFKYKFIVIPQIQKIILRGPELTELEIEDRLDELVRLLPRAE